MLFQLEMPCKQFCDFAALVASELLILEYPSRIRYTQRSPSYENEGGSTVGFGALSQTCTQRREDYSRRKMVSAFVRVYVGNHEG